MLAVFWYKVVMELDRMQGGLEWILQIDNDGRKCCEATISNIVAAVVIIN